MELRKLRVVLYLENRQKEITMYARKRLTLLVSISVTRPKIRNFSAVVIKEETCLIKRSFYSDKNDFKMGKTVFYFNAERR